MQNPATIAASDSFQVGLNFAPPPYDPKVDYMGLYLQKYLHNKQILATFTQECVSRNAVLDGLIRLENESAAAAETIFGGIRLSPYPKNTVLPHLGGGTVSPTLIQGERISKLVNDPRAYITPQNDA